MNVKIESRLLSCFWPVSRGKRSIGKSVSNYNYRFQITGIITRKVDKGRPRDTTPVDDRYVALNAPIHRELTAGELSWDLSVRLKHKFLRKSSPNAEGLHSRR
ncbi:hypothetical protein AVEN_236837-1 [Araneus ventricosus]|uniref:Uncharacterized protein n=1 Tax=Araneus ventricosus TaxID=182803 RepID=A0A4Y2KWM3_ARAVE|nr:hypothetical protein AVEN_236837-1 [Araneus ventricosus]